MKADRVLVVQYGNSWQATMRNGGFSAVGEFRHSFDEAVASGHEAFTQMLSERRKGLPSKHTEKQLRFPITEPKPSAEPAPKTFDPLEDI